METVYPIQTGLLITSCDQRGGSQTPHYNFKTTHATATKITQNIVLIISNFPSLYNNK